MRLGRGLFINSRRFFLFKGNSMEDIDREILEANQKTVSDNFNFSESQINQLKKMIRKENQSIVTAAQRYKDQNDYLKGRYDSSKQNFDQYCEIGAKTIDANPTLRKAFREAENRAEFLYDVGVREAAFQEKMAAQQGAAQNQQPFYQPQQGPAQQPYPAQAAPAPQYNFPQQVQQVPPPAYPMTPEPQQGSAPYAGNLDPRNVPWKSLTAEQFEKYSSALGIPI